MDPHLTSWFTSNINLMTINKPTNDSHPIERSIGKQSRWGFSVTDQLRVIIGDNWS
jgi:hypothetical protein